MTRALKPTHSAAEAGGRRPDAPALVAALEASGVRLARLTKTELAWDAGREPTGAEAEDLRSRRDAVLDVLAARNLRAVNACGSDVVPALRAILLDHPGWGDRGARRLGAELHRRGYLDREPREAEVAGGLTVLGSERGSAGR